MKKTITILIALVLAVAVVGCSANNSSGQTASSPSADVSQAPAEDTAPERTPTMQIGMLVSTLQAEFFVSLTEGMKGIFEDNGYKMSVTSYDNDSNKAISIIENYTISDVDCIIAMVSENSCDTALKAAMDKGIKVVVPGVETGYYDLCLLADNKDVGTKIGEMASDFINTNFSDEEEVQVAAFVSTSSVDMADRSNAMLDTLKELAPNATVVGTSEYQGVGEATAAMENFLQQYPDIKVVASYGDQGALEAVEVVKAANKAGDDFAAFGCDATQQGLKLIADGDIFRGTVFMGDLVEDVTSKTLRLLEGDPTLEKRNVTENIKITEENATEYLSE